VLKVEAGKELLPALAAVLRGEKFLSSGVRDCDPQSASAASNRSEAAGNNST
jgi:hypothetical protein